MTDETREALTFTEKAMVAWYARDHYNAGWKAATAAADARYLPVIQKLVEALAGEQRLREIIRNADPRVEDYHAYRPTDNETHNALALAKPLLEKKEES